MREQVGQLVDFAYEALLKVFGNAFVQQDLHPMLASNLSLAVSRAAMACHDSLWELLQELVQRLATFEVIE
jgi:hypothetical protein